MRLKLIIFILLITTLALPITARAQSGTPTEPSAGTGNGSVQGMVKNATPGGKVPESLDLVLHAWDQDGNEKLMVKGKSGVDGSFQFDKVAFDPALVYGVMATYDGVTYYSDYQPVKQGDTALKLDIQIYESASDTSLLKTENFHTLFFFDSNGLQITEVYVLSNTGDRSIKEALTLPSGRKATMMFPLPENASDVQFRQPDRFIQVADGFADTEPVLPGSQTSQVVVSFKIPYTDQASFNYQAPLETDVVSLLVPKDSGLALTGTNLSEAGVQPSQSGPDFLVYTYPGLKPGDKMEITVHGQGSGAGAGNMSTFEGTTTGVNSLGLDNPKVQLGLGGGALGLSLVIAGIWFYRKTSSNQEEDEDDEEDNNDEEDAAVDEQDIDNVDEGQMGEQRAQE